MGVFRDLTGMKFDRLTVIELAEKRGQYYYWRCKCECGNEKVIRGNNLTSNVTHSCGCLQKERPFEDLSGQNFGELTVLELAKIERGRVYFKCRCTCGNICIVRSDRLKRGQKSCGCLRKEAALKAVRTHGLSKNKLYRVWASIKERCFNLHDKSYKNYGGRGITMWEGWVNDFQAFYDYVGELEHFGEEGFSLDRINNDGNYEPDNLRWADRATQQRNRRTNHIVDYEGQKIPLIEAAEKSSVQVTTLYNRIKRGETGEYLFRLPR